MIALRPAAALTRPAPFKPMSLELDRTDVRAREYTHREAGRLLVPQRLTGTTIGSPPSAGSISTRRSRHSSSHVSKSYDCERRAPCGP